MSFSRYNLTEKTIYNGQDTYGLWKQHSFLTATLSDDQIGTFVVTSNYEGKPALIAYEIYRESLLDWVLLAFNDVRDPFTWPKTGTIVKYPIESLVFPELLQ